MRDFNGDIKTRDFSGNDPVATIGPGISLTTPKLSISQSTPSFIPPKTQPNGLSLPFEGTKTGLFLNTLQALFGYNAPNTRENPYLRVGRDLIQGATRSIGSIGVSLANAFKNQEDTTKTPGAMPGSTPSVITPNNSGDMIDSLQATDFHSRLAQDVFSHVFGNEPIESLEKRIATNEISIKTSPFAQSTGISHAALPLAFGGVLGDAVLNLTPVGGEENLIKNLASEKNADSVFTLLLKSGVPDDVAREVAPEFAKLTNPKEVQDLFNITKSLTGSKFITENLSGNSNLTHEIKTSPALDYLENIKKDDNYKITYLATGKDEDRALARIFQQRIEDGKVPQNVLKDFYNTVPPITDMETGQLLSPTDGIRGGHVGEFLDRKLGSGYLPSLEVNSKGNLEGTEVGRILSSQESALTITPQENPIVPNDVFDSSYSDSINPETGIVNPPAVRGGLKSPELNFRNWKDKPTFSLARETFERNIESVANPEDAVKLKEFIIDPIRANEDALVKFVDPLKNKVKGYMSDLGIKAGSKEDRLVQQFGEGLMSMTELADKTPKWKEVQDAADYFRKIYDQLLDKVNASRAEYNYKPIPKRPDYFRHFQEITNVVRQLGTLFRESDLPTEIAGITDIFKPGKPFSTAELRRKGTESTISAIKGFDNYIESISKQIFHIDSVQRVRALEKYIRVAAGEDAATLPSFVANINEYGNLLAGKAAKLDRAVESTVGRRVFKLANILKQQTGISLVAGNISSALTNFLPFTQSLATTEKLSAAKGLLDAMIAPFARNITDIGGTESKFLLRRFKQGKIAPSITEKVLDKAGWLFKTIDQFVSHSVVAGKYYENIGKGMAPEEAMHAADEYAGKVLADRSFGQLPNLMGSKTAGFVTQFQTEVNNMYSFLTKDIPKMSGGNKSKMLGAFGQFVLYSYLFNDAYQEVTGRRPTIDPIFAAMTLLGQTDQSHNVDFITRAKTASQDIAGNLPFGNLIPGLGQGGRLPVASLVPDFTKLSQGQLTELLNPVSLQLKKSIQGASAVEKGKVTTPSGKIKFRIPQTTENFIRATLFGPNSLPQASKYYDTINTKKTSKSTHNF